MFGVEAPTFYDACFLGLHVVLSDDILKEKGLNIPDALVRVASPTVVDGVPRDHAFRFSGWVRREVRIMIRTRPTILILILL